MDKITELKQRLVKQASGLVCDNTKRQGAEGPGSEWGSWLGRVCLYREDEGLPMDENGDEMLPLAQICVEELPHVPEVLRGTRYLTLFVGADGGLFDEDLPAENGTGWLVREYTDEDRLVVKDLNDDEWDWIKPAPLKSFAIEEAYPDGETIPGKILREIIDLEKAGELPVGDGERWPEWLPEPDFEVCHIVGGYPIPIQGAPEFDPGYEFAVQITSDASDDLNIVDNGNLYLAKNRQDGAWQAYWDCY